jgi:hypothetical protein
VYHAGVLRALQEAGVKTDVVAGHGVGAATALLAAIDGGGKLWDAGGLWFSPAARHYYNWRWPLRFAARLTVPLAIVCAIPLAVFVAGAALYAAGFLSTLAGLNLGASLVTWVSARMADALAGSALPTLVPRLVMLVVLAMALVLAAGLVLTRSVSAGMGRTARGRWWWRLLAFPLDVASLDTAVTRCIWDLVRGAATIAMPTKVALSRRYSEVLTESLGQPGCRELMLAVTDLDARRDIVGALLQGSLQAQFLASQPGRERGAEVVDLASSGRDVVVDLLGAALTPSIGAEPHPIGYPTDGFWRGETHRGCDRPGILTRLLSELDAAQVTQVIVVSAVAPTASPHRLRAPSLDLRARLGEFFTAAEGAAIEDAVRAARTQFDALYLICPAHNPLGPFDLAGSYDEASDRQRTLGELEEQGYRDAYQQFIEPIIGASGDQLARR